MFVPLLKLLLGSRLVFCAAEEVTGTDFVQYQGGSASEKYQGDSASEMLESSRTSCVRANAAAT